MSRPMVEAAYAGTCGACDEHYEPGTWIQPGVGGWVHRSCPDPLRVDREPCTSCWQVPSASGACGCDS